ncbi:MAG: hypothetical protein LBI48_02025 [Burkholderiaceae bacterium]|jgi:hypothetical protein|nr:hypothetical protein [Burkholderiaceae bacterium]
MATQQVSSSIGLEKLILAAQEARDGLADVIVQISQGMRALQQDNGQFVNDPVRAEILNSVTEVANESKEITRYAEERRNSIHRGARRSEKRFSI